jgi:hypothetical protein
MKQKIKNAAKLFQAFTGHDAEHVDTVRIPDKDVAMVVGTCDGILYTTVRDGKTEKYIHKFKRNARPLLCASHDGKRLYLIAGSYKFTDRGIVDDT